jgi:hypothetical protein
MAACTVPAELLALCEPPPPTCAVPMELSAVCVPPEAGIRAADVVSAGSAVKPLPMPTLVGLVSEPSAFAPGSAAWTVPAEPVAVWEPPPPTCAVPIELLADCGPPELGVAEAETTAFGFDVTPSATLAVVGAFAAALAAVAGGCACTVPTELPALCGPEPTCAVPTELCAVCEPPEDGCVAAETVAVGFELEVPVGSTVVGAEAPAPTSTAGGWTWTVPIDPVAVWSAYAGVVPVRAATAVIAMTSRLRLTSCHSFSCSTYVRARSRRPGGEGQRGA